MSNILQKHMIFYVVYTSFTNLKISSNLNVCIEQLQNDTQQYYSFQDTRF